MKKFGLFLLVATMGLFAACSSDKKHDEVEPVDYAKEIEGKYWGDLAVTLPGEPSIPSKDNVTLTRTKDNAVKLVLKNFTFLEEIVIGDIIINNVEIINEGGNIVLKETSDKVTLPEELGSVKVTATVKGKAVGKKLDLTLDITDVPGFTQAIKVSFVGNKLDNANQEVSSFDFEEWYRVNPKNTIEGMDYYAPVGEWASSNDGVATLIAMSKADKFCVIQSEGSHSGKSAARIETLKTKGSGKLYPDVTAGSLFLGAFNLDFFNRLASSKFGAPFTKKPLKVKGFYKYKSGAEFLRCADPSVAATATPEAGTKDKFAISAVLYSYDPVKAAEDASGTTKKYSTYLTGVNIYDKTKYTAIAKLEGADAADYTGFTLDMKYIDEGDNVYDKTKSYRLAIIASSSAEGDSFSGAPGSVLYLDDIEIISE